jgi:hypothetical protein
MKTLVWVFMASFGFSITAIAQDKAIPSQLDEPKKLVDSGFIIFAEFEAFLGQNRPADQTLNVLCEHKAALKAARLGKGFNGTRVSGDFTPENYPVPDDCAERAKKGRRVFTSSELLEALEITDRTSRSSISSDEAIRAMDKLGYLPDKWPGLLALAAGTPDLQRLVPIVALGSTWCSPVGVLFVPFLGGRDSGLNLDLDWFGAFWDRAFRFLAVRK